jgi:NAD(P)-dependent dehydrogenase (short-subunit alcohol dehydrogenase family)
MSLSGTSALVTGGSSGLGLATARALSDRGAAVVVVSRGAEHGRRAAAEVGGRHVAADVCDPAGMAAACDLALSAGPLRSLVLCAGAGHAERTIDRTAGYDGAHDLDAFRRILEVNTVGTFNCIRLGASAMARCPADDHGRRGAIVVTSSLAATGAEVGQAAYAASKAALLGLLRPVARDLAPFGIRINAVKPSGFDTPIFGPAGISDPLREKLAGATIFPRRVGRPEEFARLVVELLGNDYLNATAVDLDAGMTVNPR